MPSKLTVQEIVTGLYTIADEITSNAEIAAFEFAYTEEMYNNIINEGKENAKVVREAAKLLKILSRKKKDQR